MGEWRSLAGTLSRSLEFNRAIGLAVAAKIWGFAAALVTTLLIAVFFSPSLQGYYYTFGAVLALQAFAELGLGSVLTYYASHEWAKLEFDRDGDITGDPQALSRLSSLGRFAIRWYVTAGAILTVGLVVGGSLFFGAAPDPGFEWRPQWLTLCVLTGVNLSLIPLWALLEGCNQVEQVYLYRLAQSVLAGLAAWAAIYSGAGLWVASIVATAGFAVVVISAFGRYARFLRRVLLSQPAGARISWRADIWPMQWRIALSWAGGYLTFCLFSPVLFHYHGSVVAGQMGMTWAFVSALMTVASSWVLPSAPRFGLLIAEKKYEELDRIFWRVTITVVMIVCMGALTIWAGVVLLNALDSPFADRLLPPTPTACLLIATIIVSVSLPMSTYLRAHKKEPLMPLSLAMGVLTSAAVVVLGKYYSAAGVAFGYLLIMSTVTPFVALVWHRRRAEWHA
jgi:hypothetical protein